MKIVFKNVISLLIFIGFNYLSLAVTLPGHISVASFFNERDTQAEVVFNSAFYTTNIMQVNVKYQDEVQTISETDTFESTNSLCGLIENGIGGIFTVSNYKTASIIESICFNKEIPAIAVDWRPTATYTSNYTTVINFFPEQQLYFQGLGVIVKSLQWRSFFVLYEKPENMIRLQNILELQNYDPNNKYNSIIFKELGPGPDYRPVLKQVQNSTEYHILLDCETENIVKILSQGKSMKLLEDYYSIFITSLDAHTVDLSMLEPKANITTIRIIDPESDYFQRSLQNWNQYAAAHVVEQHLTFEPYSIKTETALLFDAVKTFIGSVNALHVTGAIMQKQMNCYDDDVWGDGFRIARFILSKNETDSCTGPIEFDEYGRRKNFIIYVVEGFRNELLATWRPEEPKKLNLIRNESEMKEALQKKGRERVWRVVSILGPPYLMKRPDPEMVLQGNARYEGFSMDLIKELAEKVNFTFEFKVLPVNDRGSYDPKTKSWTGLIKEVLDREAELAICDLTITPERREAVDFSTPFMRLGISILYSKAEEEDPNMYAFLKVFSDDVWIYSATLYLVITIVIYFISRLSPTDWENPHPCDENPEELENIWDMKNCLWLTMGGILNQGCDLLPKGISSRMASSMWWFFAIIVTNSYMANLASFLVNERKDTSINSVEDLASQNSIKYGTLEKGSTRAFFETSNYSVYQRMWTNMQQSKPTVFEKSNTDGVARVNQTKNRLYAFLMESSTLEYEIETECNLMQIGKWLDNKAYGIAMPLDYVFRTHINEAILELQEHGKISAIKKKWWKEKRASKTCSRDTESDASNKLALKNVGGVFIVLGVGLALSYMVAIAEFLWNVKNVAVEEHMTFVQALKVEILFVFNFWITRKKAKPQIPESNSSSRSGSDAASIVPSLLQGAESILHLNFLKKSATPGSSNHAD